MSALLSIARLRKRHGERLLLDIADFQLDAGCAYVLTGVNGVGKSSLLRILCGLEPAEIDGAVFLGEPQNFAPFPPAMRAVIAYVHQHPVMFSTSVTANIAYGLKARGMARSEIAARVDEAMDWAGIAHLRERHPAILSGGEKQRVALARARVLQPKILLLDEPTANLDGAAREQVIALIPTLTEAGCSVVMACHDRDLISQPGVRRWKLRDAALELRYPEVE
jgi:tungstate transport system ATP-binding protein